MREYFPVWELKVKRLIIVLVLPILVIGGLSACKPSSESWQIGKHWQIGEHWQYSPQAIWGDIFIGTEYIFSGGLEAQYISTYNLHTREKQRVTEFPVNYLVDEPSIYNDRVVWASCYYSQEMRESPQKDIVSLNWDVFLLDLKTGELQQITTEEHAQTEPRIYGDTIVWLDTRHEAENRYPHYYDVYAYDLNTNQERRLTSTNSIMENDLGISGDLVVWTDSRYAELSQDGYYRQHDNNEIYVYNLTTGQEKRITTYPGNDCHPVIDDGRIVWLREWEAREADIFLHDMKDSREIKISESGFVAYNSYPSIYKNLIVWADARISQGNTAGDIIEGGKSGAAEIYLYNLDTKQETQLVPSLTEGEYTLEVGGQDMRFTQRQVWMRPMVCGDYVVYEKEIMIGPTIHAIKLSKE
ncbi:MAG: hypothetical protein JSW16_00455 [Dehalococcoidales bacterium]|nr:MAG: hypothetical protein JSW16_00455 [Dehalococcoidales bacterium]